MIENLTAKDVEQAFGLSEVVLETNAFGARIVSAKEDFQQANLKLQKLWLAGSLVPQCTQRQLRLWLNSKNLLSTVESAISSASKAVQIEWEFANEFRRDHPAIAAIGAIVGLTESQIDQAFEEASEI